MTSSARILVVDDEPPIRKLLRVELASQGYEVLEAADAKSALEQLAKKPALVILDLGLPDIDGLQLLGQIRAGRSDVPVIVLSSRGDEAGKVAALDLGADDYVTKPFGMDELFARIRAALRHQLHVHGERQLFRVGNLSVDLVRRVVKLGDTEVKLSPRSMTCFACWYSTRAKCSRIGFSSRSFGTSQPISQYLRVYVRQLRRKIEADPERPQIIMTEIGVGYRLRTPD